MNSFSDYCSKLGSTSPVPGGGSAAGLVLSIGAAAIEKAVRFSFKDESIEFIEFIRILVLIREDGIRLSDEDINAFENWNISGKLPKSTDEEKKKRTEKINYYAKESTKIPFEVGKRAILLLETADRFLPFCIKSLVSDLAVGVSLGAASFESSRFNVMINFPYIKDKEFESELASFYEKNFEKANDLKEKIYRACTEKLDN